MLKTSSAFLELMAAYDTIGHIWLLAKLPNFLISGCSDSQVVTKLPLLS